MPVSADPDDTVDDTVLSVRLEELRSEYPATVRAIAGRWAEGLKALLGLAGTIGLLAAPFATEHLGGSTRVFTGVLLSLVFAAGALGLWLTMTAAYGTGLRDDPPESLGALEALLRKHGDRDRTRLIWGRRAAGAALLFLAAAVGIAWIDPWSQPTSLLKVTTTDEVVYCGPELNATKGQVALHSKFEGRVKLELSKLSELVIVETCDG